MVYRFHTWRYQNPIRAISLLGVNGRRHRLGTRARGRHDPHFSGTAAVARLLCLASTALSLLMHSFLDFGGIV